MVSKLVVMVTLSFSIFSSSLGESGTEHVSIKMLHSYNNHVAVAVILEKHKNNRTLKVECESENFYRSSTVDLNESSPMEFIFEFYLNEGEYLCKATVWRSNGDQFYNQERFYIY